MKEKPNFYAVIPASVRYDESLSSSQKLFYAEITAMSEKKGYCWASNSYFAKVFGVAPSTVSSWKTGLQDKGHISVKYERNGKNIVKRLIYPIQKTDYPSQETDYPYSENQDTLVRKPEGGWSENPKENTTRVNDTSVNDTSTIYPFEDFWNDYDKKVERKKCEKKWKSISEKDRKMIKEFLPIYKNHQPDSQFRKNPSTFLNDGIWTDIWDEYLIKKHQKTQKNGIAKGTPEHGKSVSDKVDRLF